MSEQTLQEIRTKFVHLMRTDPPERLDPMPREPLAPVIDRWVARRFSWDEVNALFHMELELGEVALSQWFAGVLEEAGVERRKLH